MDANVIFNATTILKNVYSSVLEKNNSNRLNGEDK